jgi:hypothetical protein
LQEALGDRADDVDISTEPDEQDDFSAGFDAGWDEGWDVAFNAGWDSGQDDLFAQARALLQIEAAPSN